MPTNMAMEAIPIRIMGFLRIVKTETRVPRNQYRYRGRRHAIKGGA